MAYPLSAVGALPSGVQYTLSLFAGQLNVTTPIVVPQSVYGGFDCANAFDRALICMLLLQDPAYPAGCTTEPIGCFDQTLVRFS